MVLLYTCFDVIYCHRCDKNCYYFKSNMSLCISLSKNKNYKSNIVRKYSKGLSYLFKRNKNKVVNVYLNIKYLQIIEHFIVELSESDLTINNLFTVFFNVRYSLFLWLVNVEILMIKRIIRFYLRILCLD